MKTLRFECEDDYEAEKLAGLISVQKDGTVLVSGIAAIFGNEIVIQLKDRSSHAVLLNSRPEVEKLSRLLSEVLLGKAIVLSSESSGRLTEIVID